jgi:hypothetical protein
MAIEAKMASNEEMATGREFLWFSLYFEVGQSIMEGDGHTKMRYL